MSKLEKVSFRDEEVIAFLEELIIDGSATQEESNLYEAFKWSGKLKGGRTYSNVVKKMKREYMGR